ncbi:hypothetical protein M6B38_347800 [Iris pallida]|uniref:Uncharacterized protein n=1 Tax=Iris pallida TaxID=29817 RepID=A0AAX6GTJ3_IRIPA|nr:hypothetical protein M6B38_347800 [Iris pallida]
MEAMCDTYYGREPTDVVEPAGAAQDVEAAET